MTHSVQLATMPSLFISHGSPDTAYPPADTQAAPVA